MKGDFTFNNISYNSNDNKKNKNKLSKRMRRKLKKMDNSKNSHPLLNKKKNKNNNIEVGKKLSIINFAKKVNKQTSKDNSKLNFSINEDLSNLSTNNNKNEKFYTKNSDKLFNNVFIHHRENNKNKNILIDIDNETGDKNHTFNDKNKSSENKKFETITLEDALHENIMNYIIRISPSESDNQQRHMTIHLLKLFFNKHYPSYKLDVFGSFPQNLHLRDSDIDIVITKQKSNYYGNYFSYQDEQKMLCSIRRTMVSQGFSTYENTLFINASVPIVKAKCERTKINIDISVGRDNGIVAKEFIINSLKQFPNMRIIIKLIKDLLRKNKLNDTCTGGVGSFLVFNLVYAYFLYLKRNNKQNKSFITSKPLSNITNLNENKNNNFSLKFKKPKSIQYYSDDDSYEILTDEGTNSNPISINEDLLHSDSSIKLVNKNNLNNNPSEEEFGENFESDSSCYRDNKEMDIEEENESHIKAKEKRNSSFQEDESDILFGNVGKLFIGFLKFYVFEFDYEKYGISNSGEGKFFIKILNTDMKFSDSIIWVENITDKTHNISRGTKKYSLVLKYFRSLYYQLKAQKPESIDQNLMERLPKINF